MAGVVESLNIVGISQNSWDGGLYST